MPDADSRYDGSSVLGDVTKFALAGAVVLALFLAGSLLVLRDLGRNEAVDVV